MTDANGSASKPLKVKCTDIGAADPPYVCFVTQDGRQLYFEITESMARLHASRWQHLVDTFPWEKPDVAPGK